MSQDNHSYLRFSLEESVWFQKGQEVDDLISISLDPDITIQESDQYITIKGSLELSGEYSREEDESVEADYEDFFTNNPRTVQLVELREDEGTYAFTHQFPVEVTIPKNRIQNLEEIDVRVETFDYAFPENSCLRLTADLMIIGLYDDQQNEFDEQEAVEIEIEEIEELDDDPPTFSDEHEDFTPYLRPEIPEIDINEVYQSSQVERNMEDSEEDVTAFSKPDIFEEETDELYEPFEVEARKIPQEEEEKVEVDQPFTEKYPDISLVRDEEEESSTVEPIAPVLEEVRKEAPVQEQPIKEAPVQEAPILKEETGDVEAVPEITFTPQQSTEEKAEDF